jgi:hypothetical protein
MHEIDEEDAICKLQLGTHRHERVGIAATEGVFKRSNDPIGVKQALNFHFGYLGHVDAKNNRLEDCGGRGPPNSTRYGVKIGGSNETGIS